MRPLFRYAASGCSTTFVRLTAPALCRIFKRWKGQRIFLVHGKRSFSLCGAKALFDEAFHRLGIEAVEYTNFRDNPVWQDLQDGLAVFKASSAAAIAAVGGGSAIDTAKLVRFFSEHAGDPLHYDKAASENKTPLYLFPTTAGSGSESTHFAVSYVDDQKHSVSAPAVRCDAAFVDYRLTLDNPPYLTACTGVDALCHAVESYWAIRATDKSKRFARQAIRLILPSLLPCIRAASKGERVPRLRRALSMAAHYAGQAIDITTTTAAHAYSYRITSLLGYPHGHAAAMSLPLFMRINSQAVAPRIKRNYDELTHLLGMDAAGLARYIMDCMTGLYEVRRPTAEQWEEILKDVNMERLSNNPVNITGKLNADDFLWG